ncbi:MAG: DoxX-like family protein [Hyphomicrobiaceae bacterium]
MNVLVLGAYGLIGREIASELVRSGHQVTGLARDASRGRALLPGIAWIGADIAKLTEPDLWRPHLAGIDAVVNAAGALQSGGRDDLKRLQRDAVVALVRAMELGTGDEPGQPATGRSGIAPSLRKFVQISAPGADPAAPTEFMATKGAADEALRASHLDWTILKPGLVIAPTAYGGTALIRMLAAFPLVQPVALAQTRIATVDVAEVGRAVARALADQSLSRRSYDLVETDPPTLLEIVLAFRRWLGFPAPALVVATPAWLVAPVSALADLAGRLGWRPPLRSTAMRVLAGGVVGDPAPWQTATGENCAPLAATLARLPATRQERVFARLELAFPLLLVMLALFWIASGTIGLWQREAAMAVLADAMPARSAAAAVVGGALLDLGLGFGMLIARWHRWALVGSIALSLAYLALGTLLTPALWADPLGPFAKVVPVIGLALALLARGDER